MLRINSQGEELGGMSPPLKRHLELEIKTLQNAPRDADKLRRLLQVEQDENTKGRIVFSAKRKKKDKENEISSF